MRHYDPTYTRSMARNFPRHADALVAVPQATDEASFVALARAVEEEMPVTRYAFRLVNVFAESPLAGNPLCVFEDARGLDTPTMQALALQFNLSETTFVLPSTAAPRRCASSRPTFEMPFAGHPTLGTAHVVRALRQAGDRRSGSRAAAHGEPAVPPQAAGGDPDRVTLEMKAGVIPVAAAGDVWTLDANAPRHRAVAATRAELAAMLGLAEDDVAPDPAAPPLWVDTGSEQLVIPLASAAAVARAAPRADLLQAHGGNGTRAMAYVFAPSGPGAMDVRFFFPKHGSVLEDPGTGSACANLGGWLLATGAPLPQRLSSPRAMPSAAPAGWASRSTADRSIRVSGRVVELGRGTVSL